MFTTRSYIPYLLMKEKNLFSTSLSQIVKKITVIITAYKFRTWYFVTQGVGNIGGGQYYEVYGIIRINELLITTENKENIMSYRVSKW